MSLRGEEANPFQGHVDSTTYPAPRSSPGHEALLPRKKPVPTRIAEVSEHIQSSPNGLKTPVQPELARWGIHWRTPSTMAILFLCGIIFALGHHFYYNSLDGEFNTGRDSQEWAIRIGTALAFLARASLDSAAAMAYMQYSWLRLRKRPTTIGGVDSILGALTDFSALVDMNKFRQSKMSSLLAILVWYVNLHRPSPNDLIFLPLINPLYSRCIPLSAIVPPAALTVNSVLKHDLLSERVPEINWPDLPTQTGGFGYWLGAGEDLYRLATTTAYGMSVLPMVPRYNNYTYDLEFFAPALKCGSVRPEAQAAFNAVLGADWNASPTTQYAYEALLVGSWILSNSNLTSSDPHLLDNELLFRTPDKNFTCQTWNVSYTAQIEFQNGAQSIRILRQRDLERFVSKTERYEVAFGEDPPEAFGYRSWLETIKFLLQGSLFSAGAQGQPRANSTKIMQTGLTGCPEMKLALVLFQTQGVPVVHDYYCRNGTLEKAIEDLGRNITFSLFGYSNGM